MILRGRIEVFDEHRGDGMLLSDDGERFYFHCVDIADGTRTIEAGATVHARRSVGRRGRDEAVAVVKVANA